jgi:hypothetical protein
MYLLNLLLWIDLMYLQYPKYRLLQKYLRYRLYHLYLRFEINHLYLLYRLYPL